MTIDALNSVRVANSIIRITTKPQDLVSVRTQVNGPEYERRLFFCPQFQGVTGIETSPAPATGVLESLARQGKNCRKAAKIDEKLLKFLAFILKFYYNKGLYNVVGLRLMQGVAKLRKVAEVVKTTFVYLKLPHIANSKGTIVAK